MYLNEISPVIGDDAERVGDLDPGPQRRDAVVLRPGRGEVHHRALARVTLVPEEEDVVNIIIIAISIIIFIIIVILIILIST